MDSSGHSRREGALDNGLDVVAAEMLLPPDGPIRGGSRTDAALVLDRELTALAGLDARCRLVLAKLVASLMDRRAWRTLGFVRLGDYARERLGMSPRLLEDDAHAVRALRDLPLLRSAIEQSAITWTSLRLVLRLATPANEARLLDVARRLTTRQLEEYLREFRDAPSASARNEKAEAPSPGHEPGDSVDDSRSRSDEVTASRPSALEEAEVRWSVTVSRSGRRMWRAACEYASRSAGSPLRAGQVLELVCAEALSASPSRRDGEPSPWMPAPESLEARLLARQKSVERRGERVLAAFLAECGVTEGFRWLDEARRDPGPARQLDRLLDGLDEADAFELDRRLQQLRLATQRIDAQMAALLRTGVDRRLFRELGFATVKLYVEARLGCSARRIWSLIAIEREAWRSTPALREAWRLGRISHLAARTLLPVMSEQHGEAWVRRAGEVTLRRLADEVAWALDHGQEPSAFDRPVPPPPDADVRGDGLGDVEAGEVQMRAHGGPSDGGLGPAGAVRLEFFVPLSVAVLAETTLWSLRRDGEAPWRTFERAIALALLEWTAAPRHRDPVFERDGWRCTVPGCSSRRNLHDHHVLFRSQGGGNARDNRTTVCAAHHLHGLHAGVIRARGRAPQEIVWELGCRRGERPLMRLRGDRYV